MTRTSPTERFGFTRRAFDLIPDRRAGRPPEPRRVCGDRGGFRDAGIVMRRNRNFGRPLRHRHVAALSASQRRRQLRVRRALALLERCERDSFAVILDSDRGET